MKLLARKNLWDIERVQSAWGVMTSWDLYLVSESWWARRTRWRVYGMIREAGRLIEDSRFKHLAVKHEETLAKRRYGHFASSGDIVAWLRNYVPSFRVFSLPSR